MTRDDEKKWQIIQDLLAAEASGKTPRVFSSKRTLFGIPSTLDRELSLLAQENSQIDASDVKTNDDDSADLDYVNR